MKKRFRQIYDSKINYEQKVGIIGCGTIGSNIISDLVSSGAQNFILVDNDVVELSNLSRQTLFKIDDIDKKKIDIMKEFIIDRCKNANVILKSVFIQKYEELEF